MMLRKRLTVVLLKTLTHAAELLKGEAFIHVQVSKEKD